jgi:glycosyltransferase involved in cell wall biosynthesis
MTLKIGLVTGEFPPQEGGVGAFTQEIAKAFHRQGHDVHIITSIHARPPDGPKTKEALPEESQSPLTIWRRLEDRAREPLDIGYAQLHPRGRRWRWRENRLVTDIALRYELDVVNIQYQPAAFNMRSTAVNILPWRLRGVTLPIVTFHDLRVPYLFPKAGPLRQKVVDFMASRAEGVIVTNPEDYQRLQTRLPTAVSKLREIPIGSNITAYTPNPVEIQEAQDRLNLAEKDILLAYFGFVNPSKGADDLIKAMAGLSKKYHLVFVGGRTGASDSKTNALFLDNLERLIAAFGLEQRVHWTGYISDVRVSTFLHMADILVLPYKDGASLRRGTLMASLAHGRPIISTTPSFPTPELKHGENIWLVPPNDVNALEGAIDLVRKNSTLQEKLGQGAQALAQAFGWEKIARDTAVFYQELLTHKQTTTNYYD